MSKSASKKIEKQKYLIYFLAARSVIYNFAMTTMYYESDLEFSGMFSMCSHQRQKEKKKSDRKAGKERRKAEKTLHSPPTLRDAEHTSLPIFWCDTKKHFGTPILDEKNNLVIQNCCAECKHAEYLETTKKKVVEDVTVYSQEIIDEQSEYFDHYARMEYEFDMLDLLEAQEAAHMIRLLKMEKIWAEEEAAGVPDDYIPEIDDDYDF